jgi:hypothetical protein
MDFELAIEISLAKKNHPWGRNCAARPAKFYRVAD